MPKPEKGKCSEGIKAKAQHQLVGQMNLSPAFIPGYHTISSGGIKSQNTPRRQPKEQEGLEPTNIRISRASISISVALLGTITRYLPYHKIVPPKNIMDIYATVIGAIKSSEAKRQLKAKQ